MSNKSHNASRTSEKIKLFLNDITLRVLHPEYTQQHTFCLASVWKKPTRKGKNPQIWPAQMHWVTQRYCASIFPRILNDQPCIKIFHPGFVLLSRLPPLPLHATTTLQPPWSLCFQRAEPKPDSYAIRCEPFPSGHLSPLTDTDSLRHTRALGAPLLFRPTRKRPRQATPPSRHREQQHRERDENPIINPTALNERCRERGGKSRVVTEIDEVLSKLYETVIFQQAL